MIKICPQCNNAFKTPVSVQIYCDKKCYGLSQRKTPSDKFNRRDHYLANREAIIAKSSANQKNNRDVRRDYLREYHRKFRQKVIDFLGGKCNRCGFSDARALQIDHVNGGGNKELRSGINSFTYLKNVLSNKTGKYQLLCANCNWIKKHDQEETTKKFKTKTITKRP